MKSRNQIYFTLCFVLASACAYADVPVYNSNPSAQATIFLDFDGQYVDGTSWNWNGPINCGPSGMSAGQVTEIFNRVAEDYRPFNINITTDSTVYWAAPATQRTRIILTVTSDWYGSAGGVSYVGSFAWGDDTPAFVFTAILNYNAKYVAEAASHEAGHTLGLVHQSLYDASCVKITEYNPGLGTGEIAWAPIMGVGYYRNQTLWHNGTDAYSCTDLQDDLGVITSATNGFGYRPDDYSDTATSAATASFINNQFTLSGIIETNTDKDVFTFDVPSFGEFHLDAVPYNTGTGDAGSDLDMQVELLNSSQAVIGTYNPDLLLRATIDTVLNPGTYYLRVQGKGNIYAPEYASLGSYSLQGIFLDETVLPVHTLELHGAVVKNRHYLTWQIETDEKIKRQALEISVNGKDFQTLTELTDAVRSFTNAGENSPVSYYRLKALVENGRWYYSTVLALQNDTGDGMPYIMGTNFVHTFLRINSPSPYSYLITDYSGRRIRQGKLIQGINTVNTDLLANGLYIIRYSNGQEVYTEKWMKQ